MAISCPVVFSWISSTVWNLFPFKGDFSFWKNQQLQGTKSGLWGGWFTWMIWCCTKNLWETWAWVGRLSWWSCQSPVVHSCSLLNHLKSFHEGILKLHAKYDADFLFYLLSHFECDSHTGHMLTLQCLLSPMTSTMKLSFFTHAHSSLLSSGARLHWCHANHSHYINNA